MMNTHTSHNERILLNLVYGFYDKEKVIKKHERQGIIFIITSYRVCKLENAKIQTIFFNSGVNITLIEDQHLQNLQISTENDEITILDFHDLELFNSILADPELKKQIHMTKTHQNLSINKVHRSLLNILSYDERIIFINSNSYIYDNTDINISYGLPFLVLLTAHNFPLKIIGAGILAIFLYYIFQAKNKKIERVNQIITDKRIINLDKYNKITIIDLNDISYFITTTNKTIKITSKTIKENITLQTNQSTKNIDTLLTKFSDL